MKKYVQLALYGVLAYSAGASNAADGWAWVAFLAFAALVAFTVVDIEDRREAEWVRNTRGSRANHTKGGV